MAPIEGVVLDHEDVRPRQRCLRPGRRLAREAHRPRETGLPQIQHRLHYIRLALHAQVLGARVKEEHVHDVGLEPMQAALHRAPDGGARVVPGGSPVLE